MIDSLKESLTEKNTSCDESPKCFKAETDLLETRLKCRTFFNVAVGPPGVWGPRKPCILPLLWLITECDLNLNMQGGGGCQRVTMLIKGRPISAKIISTEFILIWEKGLCICCIITGHFLENCSNWSHFRRNEDTHCDSKKNGLLLHMASVLYCKSRQNVEYSPIGSRSSIPCRKLLIRYHNRTKCTKL